MDKIASFTVNHLKLLPGVYVSRRDTAGDTRITTFDIRMTRPNHEPVMNTAEIHTIEHLGATFLRNHKVYKDRVLYFGPMGCRTGFYLLLAGDYESADWPETMNPQISFLSFRKCFPISGTLKGRSPAQPPGTAATTWI